MTNKVLVTGATGKVGFEVVKYLTVRKVKVRAVVHQAKNAAILAKLGAEVVSLDMNQAETLAQAFSGVNKLFLIIPSMDTDAEIIMAKKIIDYAKNINIDNIVHLSAMRAENYPTFSHKHIEQYLNNQKILHVHLHPNFFMQNFNTFFLDHIKQKKLVNIFDGGVPTSFIDTRDISEVAAKLLLENYHPCKTFTLTGSTAITHQQVAEILSAVASQDIKYTAQSDEDTHAALVDCGWTKEGIEKFILISKGIQRGEFADVYTDVSAILERPPILFEQYANDYKEFWRSH